MNLKDVANKLLEDSKRTPIRGLSAIAEAENYLQQAYEGRYFFELIQNVRDANKEKNQDGNIFIELTNNVLSISNSGAEFSAKGIEGITTIGQSTKQSQDYIGFKGIGFKSIQEISEAPSIITLYGSIHFDRDLTLREYNDPKLKVEQVPLFYFPYFNEQKLSEQDIEKGIVTRIELPLKENIDESRITDAFSEIQAKQLILLGNIETLKFTSEKNNVIFRIKKNYQKNLIEVKENDNPSNKFKYFSPLNKIEIPKSIIQLLKGRERDIFSNSRFIDVNVVLELDENEQIKLIKDAKLYLFYPLQISSGFRFIIHSYFIVNPERTTLRDSKLNNYLLSSIGKFIANEVLTNLKKAKVNTNNILCFKRNNDAKIDALYNSVVNELRKQKFIFDTQTKKYFQPAEIMVADDFDKNLFPDGKFGSKQLIYINDKDVISWLRDEFEIPYLTYTDIANQIESECKRQLKAKKLKFFQNLYNYVSQHEDLNITGRKVLLTDQWKLVSSEKDIFYGGRKKFPVNLSPAIKRHIHFINKGIKISDFREGRSRTGIIEFSTYELVRRLLKLFNKSSVPNKDLLNVLYNIPHLDVRSELEIREKILLPIKGSDKWLSPITNPIYFETEELKELYPKGLFIDDSVLKWEGKKENTESKIEFLKKIGVWDIPALYIDNKQKTINNNENRVELLEWYSNRTSKPFYIQNDRVLDIPDQYNIWFTYSIIDNFKLYLSFIQDDLLPKLQYKSSQSYYSTITDKEKTVQFSHFIEVLSTQKWICFQGEDEKYSTNEIVGIKDFDFTQAHNAVIKKFLKLLPLDFGIKKAFIEAVGLVHLDGISITNFKNLLNLVYKKYELNIPVGKEFIDFYNRILGKLVDFFYSNHQTEIIAQLDQNYFLSINEITKEVFWKKPNQIFYIDDKPNYDLLPTSIKERIQPHFTNRDKNTFGKIAGKIGKKFSNSITKDLTETEIGRTSPLISFFKFLPEAIALLESSLDTVITPYFDKLKTIRVFEKEDLRIKISVENSTEMIIPVNHFVDADLDFDIHFNANFIAKNKQISDAINELFVNLLERDLRNYGPTLLNFLNATDKNDYLRNYDIAEERINEIRDKLNTSEYSPKQRFWRAILSIKASNTLYIFNEESIDINYLSKALKINTLIIRDVEDNFDFLQINNPSNISILSRLLKALSLTLKEVNEVVFPKIDFRNFYKGELIKLNKKFERSFNAILYNHLLTRTNEEKASYQDLIDTYKSNFDYTFPLETFDLDIQQFFIKSVNTKFDFLELKMEDLLKDSSSFDPISIYTAHFALLKDKLVSKELLDEKNLIDFLANNKRRSLVYFNETEVLVEEFISWLEGLKADNRLIDKEEDLESFLSRYSDDHKTIIEEVSTKEVALTNRGISAIINGRRFDGGANEQYKEMVGLVAEMLVYEKLKSIYETVSWVSKYASKVYKSHIGYNPEGQDGLGYDIEYVDENGTQFFIEVKGRADNYDSFEITKTELEKAYTEKNNYRIFFVTNTMNNSQRRIRDLGNLFMFEDGEDFFTNTKFKAIYRNFEIRFQEK